MKCLFYIPHKTIMRMLHEDNIEVVSLDLAHLQSRIRFVLGQWDEIEEVKSEKDWAALDCFLGNFTAYDPGDSPEPDKYPPWFDDVEATIIGTIYKSLPAKLEDSHGTR